MPAAALPAAEAALREAVDSLQFDGLRLLRIYLSATGGPPVVIHASGSTEVPDAGSGRRPGGGAKSDLDLSNLFTNRGFLGDSDQNLIPDRVDVVLSAAGYLGSLGVDVSSGQGNDDPIYPETKVRPKLWNTWLPDIFLNPHGYPSHEWVQVFSEYAGWVRNRRYAFAWDTENFKMDFTNDVLIYTSITGSSGRGGGTMSNPRVTIWSGTTEAPDETAYGEWMQLVASAGLQWDKALLEYLLEGNHKIDRTETGFAGGVAFKIHRPRPATAEDDDAEVVSAGTTN